MDVVNADIAGANIRLADSSPPFPRIRRGIFEILEIPSAVA